VIGYSDPVLITAVFVGFFLVLALIVVGRTMFRPRDPPKAHRFRVGVFVERDRDEEKPPPGP